MDDVMQHFQLGVAKRLCNTYIFNKTKYMLELVYNAFI